MKYKVVLEESDEGFAASVPGLPGCHSQGESEQEALENITAAIREYLAVVSELASGGIVREVEVEGMTCPSCLASTIWTRFASLKRLASRSLVKASTSS